jgi:Replication-relaxation
MLTRLLWRLLGLAALLVGAAALEWLLHGGIGAALRGASAARGVLPLGGLHPPRGLRLAGGPRPPGGLPWVSLGEALAGLALALAALLLNLRWRARRRRCYVRVRVDAYRTDGTSVEGIVAMFEALHKRLQRRWWRRLVRGQPSVALEVHHTRGGNGAGRAMLALACPAGLERMVEAAVRSAYPNCRVAGAGEVLPCRPTAAMVRLKKHAGFIKRVKQLDRYELAREPPMDRLLTVMGASGEDALVQLALTPAPALFERYAKRRYKRHEDHLSRERREHRVVRDRSLVDDAELRGGLEVQHRPLYFVDLRVCAPAREACEQIASELRAEGAENRLVERGTTVRHGLLGLYHRRVQRGEGNPWPGLRKGVCASTELAALWHLPSIGYATVPFARSALPLAPAPPAIARPREGAGLLCDALGPVTIHPQARRQNTAVPGAVEQGKSSYLAATVAEDVRRERCAVIVLDPKGDAAEAAVSLVPPQRTCTLLDFAHPTCGFNPLAVDAPADTIADYVVGALRNLFTDADIRASSDRYLRNAIIAVLAHDSRSTLWDAARLLTVGEEGYAYRARVGAHVRTLPEFKEIAEFFTAELAAQLADARSTTTAKLDAPVNKLARLLNSPSIKRVLLNDSLAVDFDRVISGHEVLVVKGALGAMGAGNTSVLMQLLVGMLDAALARQQDAVPAEQRVAVALKVDEAPLVLNRGFAETLALKRSAGLETVACWQADAQWTDRDVRAQLDALFAHRVYFATASVRDARDAASLMMAEYSDTVRPDIQGLSALGHPDARLHLPKHHAIASWVAPEGRQAPFLARTIPLRVDPERLAGHAARQAERGGRYLADLSQPHWDRGRETLASSHPRFDRSRETLASSHPRFDRSQETLASSHPRFDRSQETLASSHPRFGQREGVAASPPAGEGELQATERGPGHEEEGRESGGIVRARGCGGESHGRGASVPRDGGGRVGEREGSDSNRSAIGDTPAPLPERAAESYAELVDLDAAHRVRRARAVAVPRPLDPDPLDLEVLALVAGMRHVLTSQIHRRFNPQRAVTTTQRRLKRLSDAALVERFQFHRRDGGGAPMCYVIAPRGREMLVAHGRRDALAHGEAGEARDPSSSSSPPSVAASVSSASPSSSSLPVAGDRRLRQARHDVHVTGWVLALERALGGRTLKLRGPEESVLSPPLRSTPAGRVAIGPGDLRLPGGRAPHDFLRTDAAGARVEVERFETVRPDASVEVGERALLVETAPGDGEGRGAPSGGAGSAGVCLLVELDDRLPTGLAAAKLERYDHLLAGWSMCAPRFTRRGAPRPLVVFLCRDRPRARECARRADHVLSACRAYAGEYPCDWEYPGRAAVVFASERDAHEGHLLAYGVPRLPPEVRAAGGDHGAREGVFEPRELLPGARLGYSPRSSPT